MSAYRQTQIPHKKRTKKEDSTEATTSLPSISGEEKRQKLEELDEFMESVLQKAGEEFLDEFKQIEGE